MFLKMQNYSLGRIFRFFRAMLREICHAILKLFPYFRAIFLPLTSVNDVPVLADHKPCCGNIVSP